MPALRAFSSSSRVSTSSLGTGVSGPRALDVRYTFSAPSICALRCLPCRVKECEGKPEVCRWECGALFLPLDLACLGDALVLDRRLLLAKPPCLVLCRPPLCITACLAVNATDRLPRDTAVLVHCDEHDATHLTRVAHLSLRRAFATSTSTTTPASRATASRAAAARRCRGRPIRVASLGAALTLALALAAAALAAALALAAATLVAGHLGDTGRVLAGGIAQGKGS